MSQNVNGCLRRYGRYVYCLDFRQFAKSISQLKIIDCFTLYNQNGFIPIGYLRVAMDDIDTVILQGLHYLLFVKPKPPNGTFGNTNGSFY